MPSERFEQLAGMLPVELREALAREVLNPDPLESEEVIRRSILEEAAGATANVQSALEAQIGEAVSEILSSTSADTESLAGVVVDNFRELSDDIVGATSAVQAALHEEVLGAVNDASAALAAESQEINDRIGVKSPPLTTVDATPTVIQTITPSPYAVSRLEARVVAHRTDRLEAACYNVLALARAVPGSSILTLNSNPGAGETVTLDATVYTFVVAPAAAFEVTIGGSAQVSIDNLVAAINLTGTPGVEYGAGTTKHPTCSAVRASASTMEAVALLPGVAGNAIATTETLVDALSVWTGATLAGGTDMSVFGTVVTTEYEDDAAWAVAIAANGSDVEISVTGVALTTIKWLSEATLLQIDF